uniref:Carboxylic ester hydrolase n=1 Tax=Glossina brevipalpis TaxID=37001 RepID=A0A1A9WQZ2_9MUSC
MAVSNEEHVTACIPQLGCVEGIEMPGYRTEKYEAFLGVPYAKPPVGELRFKNPEPVQPWTGILRAIDSKPDCIQKNYLIPGWPVSGEEDCLYLNIYRPSHCSPDLLLPVVFYIFPGGLFTGSINPNVNGPEYLMDTGKVLLVTINYRLGVFGFLSTGDEHMPGNFGLKDQLLALHWVKDNIAAFGGNPEDVTLLGHSAGASSVHLHTINSKAKGLFHRAILGSGTALAPYVELLQRPLEQARKVAEVIGIKNAYDISTQNLTEHLRLVESEDLLNSGDSLKIWQNHILCNYHPVLEDCALNGSYLTEDPVTVTRLGNFTQIPWLMGMMSYHGEGGAVAINIINNEELREEFNDQFSYLMLELLQLNNKNFSDDEKNQKMHQLLKEYMNDAQELNSNTKDGFLELITDIWFYYPWYKTLKYYLNYVDVKVNPVYLYKFSYLGTHSYAQIFTGGSMNRYDSVHLDDLLYVFRQSAVFPDFDLHSTDANLSKDFVDMLVQFIQTGKPLYYSDIDLCTKENFQAVGDSGICNYLEFVNDNQEGFKKISSNAFPVKRMRLLQGIFGN